MQGGLTGSMESLAAMVERRSVLRGRIFELSSGKKSKYFYNGKRALLAVDMKIELAEAMLALVADVDYDLVGGVAVGSVPIAEHMSLVAMMKELRAPFDTFYVRKEPKEHGTREQTFMSADENGRETLGPGVRVLIVDDVMTTGTSLEVAFKEVKRLGAQIVGVIVLVDRLEPEGAWLRDDEQYNFRALFTADADGHLTPTKAMTPA